MTRVWPLVTSACAFALLLLLCTVPAHAVDPTRMPTPQLEARYLALTHEFRCPVCEDESLADSDEPYAAEVRQQIRSMLLAGDSDRQISDFLVSRYTAFITFKPAYSLRNAWLWLAPVVLLVIGILVAWRIIRARSELVDQDAAPVDDDLILQPAPQPPDARLRDRRPTPAVKSATPR